MLIISLPPIYKIKADPNVRISWFSTWYWLISINFNTDGPIKIPAIKNNTTSGTFKMSLSLLHMIPVIVTTAKSINKLLHAIVCIDDSITFIASKIIFLILLY